MSIEKITADNDDERFFQIEADGYENRRLYGTLYRGKETEGVVFHGLLEMAGIINRRLDQTGSSRQTVELRHFTKHRELPDEKDMVGGYRKGTLASFAIMVRYRQNASWQGELIWQGEVREYKSFFELIAVIDGFLTKRQDEPPRDRWVNACQIAIDDCKNSVLYGTVQNVTVNRTEVFEGTPGLAIAMSRILGNGNCDMGETRKRRYRKPEADKMVSAKVWNIYRKGGSRATFVVKVLFRENASWQGIIFWRESGEKQRFRSFMELALMISSAVSEGGKSGLHESRFGSDPELTKGKKEEK